MFHSEALMTAIHADRARDLERIGRERLLLTRNDEEPAPAGFDWSARPVAPVLVTDKANRQPASRSGGSSGPACEAV